MIDDWQNLFDLDFWELKHWKYMSETEKIAAKLELKIFIDISGSQGMQ